MKYNEEMLETDISYLEGYGMSRIYAEKFIKFLLRCEE